jgi:hypothetical protein
MDMEFRFWDHDQGGWTILNGHISVENRNFQIFYLKPKDSKIRIEITQGIGHKDQDDKKIFVGDWIENKHKDGSGGLYLILHQGDKLIARTYMIDTKCYCDTCMDENKQVDCWTYEDLSLFYALHNPKIVGNMFEHPNLYKER